MANIIILEIGDRIHLKERDGMYTIVKLESNGVHVSCLSWRINRNNPEEIIKTKFYLYSEIKCLAGGLNNNRQFTKYKVNHIVESKQQIYA